MSVNHLENGATDTVAVKLINSSQGVINGATVTLTIRKTSNDYYWTGSGWSSSATNLTMSEVGSTGVYEYNYVNSDNNITVFYEASTTATAAVTKEFWAQTIFGAISKSDISTTLRADLKALGLLHIDEFLRNLQNTVSKLEEAVRRARL